MSTPILPLAVWLSGTNQNSIPANDNALRVEAMNREIISQAVTAQPGSPSDGDTYIIAATHTGTQWATFSPKDIAIYRSGTWYAWAPVEGLIVNVAGSEFKYDGGAWTAVGGGGGSVAGSDKQVQFNDGGSFGAEAGFEYDKTSNTLTVAKVNESKGTDIASASTADIGAATGNFVHITGTTTITAFGTVAAGARRLVVFDGALTLTHNGTSLILPTGANITTAAADSAVCISEGSGNWRVTSYQRKDGSSLLGGIQCIPIACSDESTALTTGTAKVTFRMPYAFTLTDVRASVTTAPTGGTLLTVDVNEAGTTILSTKLTFDASEKTTVTAATARVISDANLADDAEMTIDIDAIGSTIAGAGLKVYLIGYKAS